LTDEFGLAKLGRPMHFAVTGGGSETANQSRTLTATWREVSETERIGPRAKKVMIGERERVMVMNICI